MSPFRFSLCRWPCPERSPEEPEGQTVYGKADGKVNNKERTKKGGIPNEVRKRAFLKSFDIPLCSFLTASFRRLYAELPNEVQKLPDEKYGSSSRTPPFILHLSFSPREKSGRLP
jgi:hypothetical protein